MEDRTLVPIEKETSNIQKRATALTIKSPDDVEQAAGLLTSIKEYRKNITERKEAITRPAMEALASARDLFRPFETALDLAEKAIKAKMLEFHRVEVKEEATPTKMKTRELVKVKIVAEGLIPREYLMPNMPKITEALLRGNVTIPGVKKVKEKIVVN